MNNVIPKAVLYSGLRNEPNCTGLQREGIAHFLKLLSVKKAGIGGDCTGGDCSGGLQREGIAPEVFRGRGKL